MQDESNSNLMMELTRSEPRRTGARNSSLKEQARGSRGARLTREGETSRTQDGGTASQVGKEGSGLKRIEEFSLELVLSGDVRPAVLHDERDALSSQIADIEDRSVDAGKKASRRGRGGRNGGGRGNTAGGGDTEENNESLRNDSGRGRRGRGRSRSRGRGRGRRSMTGDVATEETNDSIENEGGRGRRGRGRGRGRDATEPGLDLELQSSRVEHGGDDVSALPGDAVCDERDCSPNGSASISEAHNSNAELRRMRGQVFKSREGGNNELIGKEVPENDLNYGTERLRAVGSSATEESDTDLSGFILECISTRGSQGGVKEGQSAEPKTSAVKNAGDTTFRKAHGGGKRALLALECGKSDREPMFTPEMEEIIRMWLSEIKIHSNWPLYAQLAPMSPELRLQFDGSNLSSEEFAPSFKLPLFGSATIASSRAPQEDSPRSCKDILLHIGGPVWALDWCPQRPGWLHTGAEKKEQMEFPELKINNSVVIALTAAERVNILATKSGLDKVLTVGTLPFVWFDSPGKFLAVAAHPVSAPYNTMGTCLNGKGLIQIWALDLKDYDSAEEENWGNDMSSSHKSTRGRGSGKVAGRGVGRGRGRGKAKGPDGGFDMDVTARDEDVDVVEPLALKWHEDWTEGESLAQMVLGLTHEGLVTWDAKWQPVGEIKRIQERELLRLGILAVVLGDGSLQVYDVPLPSIFSKSSSEEPLIVNIEPVFKCSGLQKRGYKSIPVSLEWSTWDPHDRLLVGFHDASVGVWKFVPKHCPTETRPLMFFQADSLPLRSVAWAPDGSGPQGRHLIITAGHSGWVKFWDLRDIFRPIWDLQTSRCCISSMDWLPYPRCVLMSMDDGTLRLLGIQNASSTTPVTGQQWRGTHTQGLQCYLCSSFAIWSVQVSRGTGIVAYAGASGSVLQFQLTEKAALKEGTRAKEPHYLCGAFAANSENGPLTLISAKTSEPVQMKKSSTEWASTPTSKRNFLASCSLDADSGISSDSRQVAVTSEDVPVPKPKRAKGIAATGTICQVNRHRDAQKNSLRRNSDSMDLVVRSTSLSEINGEQGATLADAPSTPTDQLNGERFPCRNIAVHRVRWNINHLKRQWLAYGGAAGLVRCQQVYSLKKKKK